MINIFKNFIKKNIFLFFKYLKLYISELLCRENIIKKYIISDKIVLSKIANVEKKFYLCICDKIGILQNILIVLRLQ